MRHDPIGSAPPVVFWSKNKVDKRHFDCEDVAASQRHDPIRNPEVGPGDSSMQPHDADPSNPAPSPPAPPAPSASPAADRRAAPPAWLIALAAALLAGVAAWLWGEATFDYYKP